MKQSKKFSFIIFNNCHSLLVSHVAIAIRQAARRLKKKLQLDTYTMGRSLAVTFLWKELLEEKGYKVKAVQSDVAPLFSASC